MSDTENRDEQAEDVANKKKRTRSPMYPFLGLEEAIRRAGQLYEGTHRHSTSMESAAEFWRIKATSSALLQYVSAMKQFGLIKDSGSGDEREVQLTDSALDILHGEEGSTVRANAIKNSALNPKLHAEIWSMYKGELPPTDAPIKSFLLRHKAFNPGAVDDFITQLRGTFAFANLSKDDKIGEPEQTVWNAQQTAQPSNPKPVSPMTSTQMPTIAPSRSGFQAPPPATAQRDLPITLPSLELAVLRVHVPMSKEDFDALSNALKGMEKRLVKEENNS